MKTGGILAGNNLFRLNNFNKFNNIGSIWAENCPKEYH